MPVTKPQPLSIRVGLAVFAIGLAFIVVTVVPFFWGGGDRPVWLNVACMLAPLGFVIAVTGAIRGGRAEQRAAAATLRTRGGAGPAS
jgi:hypothetical protein